MKLVVVILSIIGWIVIPCAVIISYSIFDAKDNSNIGLTNNVMDGGVLIYILVVCATLFYSISMLVRKNKVRIDIIISLSAIVSTLLTLLIYIPSILEQYS